MAFTEFYCQSGGSNLNAGSTTDNTAPYTFTAGTWVQSTRVLTVGSTTGVTVGMWISIHTSGATATTYIARITAVTGTTITTDSSAKMGSAPANGTYDAKVGGAWRGPNGTARVPFSIMGTNCVDSSSNAPRCNMKNDATYSITTSAITLVGFENGNRALRIQGYTSTVGDGGKAIIDGGTSGSSYSLMTCTDSGTRHELIDLEFRNNGATGSSHALVFTSGAVYCERVIVHDVRGNGIYASTAVLVECEVYNCNQSNTTNTAGISLVGTCTLVRCVVHDNTGSNTVGIYATSNLNMQGCIVDSNGKYGVQCTTQATFSFRNCVFYNNTNDAIYTSGTTGFFVVSIENCDFFKNGGWGINLSGITGSPIGYIDYCRYGAGSEANSSGQVSLPRGMSQTNAITFASNANPYTDAAAGDFTTTAFDGGRASWQNTQSGYGDTTGYAYIGACQPEASAGGGAGNIPRSGSSYLRSRI